MDRASEAAANDLAEVRKLIEGMNALVNSQIQQQQQQAQLQAQQQQLHLDYPEYPTHDQQQQEAALMAATLAAVSEHQHYLNVSPSSPPSLSPQQATNTHVDSSQQEQLKSVEDEAPQELTKEQPPTTIEKPVKTKKASKNTTSSPPTQPETTEATAASAAPAADTPTNR